jgi:propanol-preferring alcohol dehydrogenase
MLAMVYTSPNPLLREELRPDPLPGSGELRLKVTACGVCRTDLHVVDGDLAPQRASVVPGHEIVGRVDAIGEGVTGVSVGQRLGVPWLGATCGRCRYCLSGEENLCDAAGFTGWTRDGGYAEAVVVRAEFCFPIPDGISDAEAAPLMCAGLIGYRAWRKACEGRPVERLGLYGFGSAAHLLAQFAIWKGQAVYAFTRSADEPAQALARSLGCRWAGGSDETSPEELDAAIIFAPVGSLISVALRAIRKGGIVVCGGIHMSNIPAFPYSILWGERRLVSVANLTRQDAREYLPLAAEADVRPHVKTYPLRDANSALKDLRDGALTGAAVLVM